MNPIVTQIIFMAVGIPIGMFTAIGALAFIFNRIVPLLDKLSKKYSNDDKDIEISNPIWPKIDSLEVAKVVARNTSEVTFLIAGITATFAIFGIFNTDKLALVDAGIYFLIGIFIRKMSRVAALVGLIIFVITKVIVAIKFFPFIFSPVFLIIFILAFINGVRATFGHHKLSKIEPEKVQDSDI